jgi:hypothetical protein
VDKELGVEFGVWGLNLDLWFRVWSWILEDIGLDRGEIGIGWRCEGKGRV